MELLPKEFKKYGYTFKEVSRKGDVAIYSQLNDGALIPSYFIVFIVQKQPASNIYGRDYPAKETVPGNSMWGQYAYTEKDLKLAYDRMQQLIDRVANKESKKEIADVSDQGEDPFGGLAF